MADLAINKVRGFASVVYLSEDGKYVPPVVPTAKLADLIRTLVPKNPHWKFVLTTQQEVKSLAFVNRAVTTRDYHDADDEERMPLPVSGCSILSQYDELLGHIYWDGYEFTMMNRRIDVQMERGTRKKVSTSTARAARIVTEYFKPMSAAEAVYEVAEKYQSEGEAGWKEIEDSPKSCFAEMSAFMRPKRNECRDPEELGRMALELLVHEELHERAEAQKCDPESMVFAAPYQGQIAIGFVDEWEQLPKKRIRPVVGDTYVCDLKKLPEQFALRIARLKQVGERKKTLFGDRLVWHADTGCKVDEVGFALWCPDPDEMRLQLNPYRALQTY